MVGLLDQATDASDTGIRNLTWKNQLATEKKSDLYEMDALLRSDPAALYKLEVFIQDQTSGR